MTLRTSDVAENCSNASSRSRVRCASSVSWVAVGELRRRNFGAAPRFGISALRRRALACLLLPLERRVMARPKVLNYAPRRLTMARLQQGFATGGMGSDRHFAWQQSSGPNVRFGSKADIERRLGNVR